MERFWRLEEDGTYIINLASIEHPSATPEPTGFCSYAPVRVQAIGGLTISPLKPEFAGNSPPEAYVTQVPLRIISSGMRASRWRGLSHWEKASSCTVHTIHL